MGTIARIKRCKRKNLKGLFLWFALTVMFGLMGFSLAAWQDGLEISGPVATGYINPDFASVVPVGNHAGHVNAYIYADNKKLSVFIDDAEPGDVYRLEYTVTTKGSVPVSFDLASGNSSPGLNVVNTLPRRKLQPGESLTGGLMIEVGDSVEELTHYGFYIELHFKQWNMLE